MSDFDKEAERERLREKYERDKQKRETTEKMSELLLQGATMTNAHCSDCNDPIFRYDGQEFCASCEKPVDRDAGAEGGEQEGDEQGNGQSAGAIEVTSPSDDARVSFGGVEEQADAADQPREQATQEQAREQQAANREQPSREQPARTGREQPRVDDAARRETEGRQPAQSREEQSRQPREPSRQQARSGTTAAGGDADAGAVRDSLVRTLRRFSEQAEACEDPQRAREHLAAAREAAETLEALRR